jgi:RNA polymerase sigma-70 factor (ECF subfamily)
MTDRITRLLSNEPGFEREVLEQYTHRLLELARRRLPDKVRARVDPEDVVQSVYRSFFRRLNAGQFNFDESGDVWRLLAAMTFHKAQKKSRFHQQQRRDVRRETPMATDASAEQNDQVFAEAIPGPEEAVILFDCLEQLLKQVPDSYRDIVVLRMEGHSIADIALRIGRSQRTVLRALARLEDLAASQLQEAS